jgi:chemotaxis protein histidine kinase CheA
MEDFKRIFQENAEKILSDFKRDLPFLKSGIDQPIVLKNIHRYAHSLKGLSAMMKLDDVYSVSDELESTLKKIINYTLGLNEDTLLEIENGFSKIEKMLKNGE